MGSRKKKKSKKGRNRPPAPKRSGRARLWVSVVLGLVFVVWGIVYFASPPKTISGSNVGENRADIPVTQDDWMKGSPAAKVTLVEYSDFQCPACGSYFSIVKRLHREFKDELRFVYRHFPLAHIHSNANLAARATEAAGKQGRFWEMHDMLFEHQTAWSSLGNAEHLFLDYAKKIDLDLALFREDLDSKAVRRAVDGDAQSGQDLNVNGTPTFFLNGVKIQNPRNYEQFKRLIQKAIDRTA
ncbi:MAG: DsbA family protein [Nitrospiria bacterium]